MFICHSFFYLFHVYLCIKFAPKMHGSGEGVKCQYCDKKLSGRNSLFSHLLRYHPESKNLSSAPLLNCTQCSQTFHHASNLHKHMRTHSTTLSYLCSLCPLAFRFSEQLKRHQQKHQVYFIFHSFPL